MVDAAKTAAPAKKAAAAPVEKPKPVALDFGKLEVKDVSNNDLKHSRGSALDGTPILDWLEASYDSNQAKAVPVADQAQAKHLESLLRAGGARLELGVKVVISDGENGTKIVKFLAKDKRGYEKSSN